MKYLISFIIFFSLVLGLVYILSDSGDAILQNEIDDTPIIENSNSQASSSVLKIEHQMHSLQGSIITQASAVVIASDDDHYFLITNYHPLIKDEFESVSIKAYDVLGRFYNAVLLTSNNDINFDQVSRDYDLALLAIPKIHELEVAKRVDRELSKNETVLAIGYPNQLRSLTAGSYIKTRYIMGFEHLMIVFSAVIQKGSSGGGLFTIDGELIGITTAALLDHDSNFIEGYAIPIRFVDEYIKLINL